MEDKKLSIRMTNLIHEFMEIEKELAKQKTIVYLGDLFFDGSFQIETPHSRDAGSEDFLPYLEAVEGIIRVYERDAQRQKESNDQTNTP